MDTLSKPDDEDQDDQEEKEDALEELIGELGNYNYKPTWADGRDKAIFLMRTGSIIFHFKEPSLNP